MYHGYSPRLSDDDTGQCWTWVYFLLTQSNPMHSGCSQLTSNPIHKYLVLNRTRKQRATNYPNAELKLW